LIKSHFSRAFAPVPQTLSPHWWKKPNALLIVNGAAKRFTTNYVPLSEKEFSLTKASDFVHACRVVLSCQRAPLARRLTAKIGRRQRG
jgi:hypothetical protein